MAFVKSDPAKATGLVAHLQKLTDTHKDKNLKTFVVFMAGDTIAPDLQKMGEAKKITIPLTFLPQGATQGDIARYKVNPEAQNTIMVYRGGAIQGSFVNVDWNNVDEVDEAVAKMLAK